MCACRDFFWQSSHVPLCSSGSFQAQFHSSPVLGHWPSIVLNIAQSSMSKNMSVVYMFHTTLEFQVCLESHQSFWHFSARVMPHAHWMINRVYNLAMWKHKPEYDSLKLFCARMQLVKWCHMRSECLTRLVWKAQTRVSSCKWLQMYEAASSKLTLWLLSRLV